MELVNRYAAALSLHHASAQTAPAVPPQATSPQPSFSPLTTRWTFPDRDAVNAGTVSINRPQRW